MRAVAYCRVSTNELDQKNSLQNQMRHYKELFKTKAFSPVTVGLLYSKERGEEYLEGIFADEGITGTKKKNRKAFDYMMKCAANREFDVIYCKNIARFARNVGDGANDLKLLKSYGIDVIFEDGGMNYKDNEAIINMFLSIAQEESRAKSVAVRFGIRKSQEQGKWTSNTPYGYDRVNGYLQINNAEANIIKQIYDHYVNDRWGQNKILKWLREEEIPTKKGGMWYQQHIKHILTNPLYCGTQTTHKTENQDVNIHSIKIIPEHEWITHKKEELRIVSDSIWKSAQDIDKKRTEEYHNNHRHSDTNLLSTVCVCGNCGSIMRRKKQKTKTNQISTYTGKYEWVCQNNDMNGTKACKFRNSMPEDLLIEFCKERIEGYRRDKDLLESNLQDYIDVYYTFDTDKKLKEIESKIEELKEEFKNEIRLNSKGIISDEMLEEFSISFKKDLNELEVEELKMKNLDNEVTEVKRKFQEYIMFLDKVDIDNLTNADLKKIFSYIKVVTDNMILRNADGKINGTYMNIINDKYSFYNKSKDEVKFIMAEHMFMDIYEGKIMEDMADRDMKWLDQKRKEGKVTYNEKGELIVLD